jgi:putative two-component system response regulator
MAGETILLVEDNQVLRDGLKALLEQEAYHILTAAHGADGLDQMVTITPDLILADITMPEMDGYAFFESVRARPEWVPIPFIFLTARREREHVLAGKKLGVEDYLLKPISPDELLTTIRSHLSRSQQLLLAQLHQSYEASLIMLANAIEVRDLYTRGHVDRVMNYALVLAEQLGWTAPSLTELRFGSILHDIGKIHIRQTTLQKSGPLNNEEWVEMKKHPLLGAELIKDIPYLALAIPVILNHHERWDGSGYPSQLVGEAIPLSARIVAVADSFDAMTTLRPYRTVMTPQEAHEEIVAQSGKMYDPEVVDVFRSAWEANHIQNIFSAFP